MRVRVRVCAAVHQRAIAVLRARRPVEEPALGGALVGKGQVLRLRVAAALARRSVGADDRDEMEMEKRRRKCEENAT